MANPLYRRAKISYSRGTFTNIPSGTENINIFNSGSQAVNKDLWCFSALHINYTGNSQATMAVKDILSTAFKSIVSSVNPTALQYVGGALANKEQVVVGRTNYITPDTGYNCLGECSFGDGECCPTTLFGYDFFLQTVELCNQLAIRMDVTANIQLANITWQAQIEWKILHCTNRSVTPKHILIGQEEVTAVNDVYWLGVPATNNDQYTEKAQLYIAKADPEIVTLQAANPTKKFYLDTAPIESTASRDRRWNIEMKGYTNNGVREYFNLVNLLSYPTVLLTSDFAENLSKINTAIFTGAVRRLDNLSGYFPSKKVNITQWGLRNPTPAINIEETILGLLFQAKMVKMMLDYNYDHSDLIDVASYQDLKQLINANNTTNNQIKGLQILGNIFIGTPQYLPVTFENENLSGVCIKNGSTYRLLVINESQSTTTKIKVDGTEITSWNKEAYFGTSLSSELFYYLNTQESVVMAVPDYSVSILTF